MTRPEPNRGLQPERTMLAWHRTALAALVAAAALARLNFPQLGWWSLIPFLALLPVSIPHSLPGRRTRAGHTPNHGLVFARLALLVGAMCALELYLVLTGKAAFTSNQAAFIS